MTPPAAETRLPAPTRAAAPSSLRHERIPRITRRDEVFLDRPRAGPADQVQQAARLVVGAARAPAPERLLPHDRPRRFIVLIEVARGLPERGIGLRQRGTVLGAHAARERAGRCEG